MARSSKIISLAVVLLLVVLVLPIATAHIARAGCTSLDLWVAKTGSDITGDGTQAQPFATIQKAIGMSCIGGTVHVAAGTYQENLSINFAVNLAGAGAPTTIIDGDGTGTVITISSNPQPFTISGFTIQGGNTASASLWNPADEQVLYAGIKLPPINISSQPSIIGGCGGGVYISETHTVTLNDCTIKNNEAEDGGGICNHGVLYMNRCTVSGNTALGLGGGIFNGPGGLFSASPDGGPLPGSMFLTNCTISGNRLLGENGEGGFGAGIYNAGHMELLNCTIANNSTSSLVNAFGGGFANTSPTTAIFKNTIVANNVAGAPGTNNCFNDLGAVITSLGHNLDSENSCGFNQVGDLINTDPLLGPLQDNGGPTFTCALLEGSPAIDAGDNSGAPPTDQRGISRPQGPAVDIGAYEFVPTEVTTIPTIPTTETHPSSSPSTLNWTRQLNPPTMSVQFVSVSPQQVTANQPVTISTNVVNTGDEGGNLNVALKINGQVEQTRMVSVGPQATQPIKFTVTRAQPGTYNVAILDKSSSFIILGTGGTTGTPANTGLIVILIIGVLVIASVMVLLLSRRPA